MSLKSINPTTGMTIKEYPEWNHEQIHLQIEKSLQAFHSWNETTYSDRNHLLKKTAKILRDRKSEYAQLITQEMGKPITQSEAEVEKCAWVCDFYAENGKKFLEEEYIQTDANVSYIQFSPLGIILGIMPWNFPFWQVFRWAAPALIAGNVTLLKHSSNVPQCGYTIEEIFSKAGFPDNVFRYLPIRSRTVENIIKDARVAAVSLTGSSYAGCETAKKAGEEVKKVVLELGGSDPFIVLPDIDLEYTVEQAVKARMINNGQSCIAAKRFIIVKDVFNEFQHAFTEKVKQLVVGDPLEKSTEIGPLARKDILEQLARQVKQSTEKKAVILTGGKKLENYPGYFYAPTVISNVKKGMPVYDEETFGPVAPLIKVNDEKEAIQIANDTIYGLGASIWA
ncbi:MAG TPA: NAD-dependent succinate-semialdehyde dehydrogenase, partial [Candidatus Atribacteria bacterium]|nr:NAD-dependent succinate-semialdehyde dehydrogenase [Candidatus Atribacteria bacterium]